MHTLTHSRMHRHTGRFEHSILGMFASAGSLLITVLTILILFFGVFLSHSR